MTSTDISARTRRFLASVGISVNDEGRGILQLGDAQDGTYGWASAASIDYAADEAANAEYVASADDLGEAAFRFQAFHDYVSFVGYEDA